MNSFAGIVTAATPEAVAARVEILEEGGNAIEAAVNAPRLHVEPKNKLYLERRQLGIPPSLLLELERRGYQVVRPLSSLYMGNVNPYFGGVNAVARENSGWQGASNPRRDWAVGHAWFR